MDISSEPSTSLTKSTQPSLSAYLDEVKARFVNEPERFAKVSQELQAIGFRVVETGVEDENGSVKTDLKDVPDGALEGIKAVLEGHRDLLVGLKAFLPEHLQVALDEQGGSGDVKIGDVKVEKSLKERFSEFMDKLEKYDTRLYTSVLNVSNKIKDDDECFFTVSELLKTNEDLRAEYLSLGRTDDSFSSLLEFFEKNEDMWAEFVSSEDTDAAPISASPVQDNNPDTGNRGKIPVDVKGKEVINGDGPNKEGGVKGEEELPFPEWLRFLKKVQKKLSDSKKFLKFMRPFSNFLSGLISREELDGVAECMIGDCMDLKDELVSLLDKYHEDATEGKKWKRAKRRHLWRS